MISSKELTFLIHGGGLANVASGQAKERPTKALIFSIRRFFPKSTIILSSWVGDKTSSYQYIVDQISLGFDPGTTTASNIYDVRSAINRHLISAKQALPLISTPYSIIIRPDVEFGSRKLLKILNKYHNSIICLAGGTLDEYSLLRKPFTFHVCDFIYAAKTETIKQLFEVPNEIDSFLDEMYFERYDKPLFKRSRWNDHYIQRWIPEAYLCAIHAKKNGYETPEHSYDFSVKFKKSSVKYITTFYELFDRKQIGIKWNKNNNEWQPGLAGALGRYSRWLFLSRKRPFSILRPLWIILHLCKISFRLSYWLHKFLSQNLSKIITKIPGVVKN
tara:strand:- start:21460 stop:22455 length:996 start_codon:yes stop_codon:yes gene_type:complete